MIDAHAEFFDSITPRAKAVRVLRLDASSRHDAEILAKLWVLARDGKLHELMQDTTATEVAT